MRFELLLYRCRKYVRGFALLRAGCGGAVRSVTENRCQDVVVFCGWMLEYVRFNGTLGQSLVAVTTAVYAHEMDNVGAPI